MKGFLLPGLFAAAVIAVCAMISGYIHLPEEPPATAGLPAHTRIASTGEWVTQPDGALVCKLTRNLTVGSFMTMDACEDWQEPKPGFAQTVPWLRNNRGFGQIHVERNWRP
jgi:hypothetical protein